MNAEILQRGGGGGGRTWGILKRGGAQLRAASGEPWKTKLKISLVILSGGGMDTGGGGGAPNAPPPPKYSPA